MVAPSGDEQVRYDIIIEAKQAIKAMQDIGRVTKDNDMKIQAFSEIVVRSANAWGISWQKALGVYKQLNAELSKQKKPTMFGQTGGKDLFGISEKYLQSLDDAGRLQAQVGQGGQQMGENIEKGSHRAARGIDAMRIALGVLVSMLIFNVIQAFQNMAQMAIKGLVEIEAAMFNIVNAEKKLSEQGVEVTVEGLQQLIKDLQVLNPMLSEFQATELISTLATKVAPALGLGQKEIERLGKSITVLAVRNQALGKSFEEVESQVITGLLSGKVTAGINQLGVKITDQIVKEEALRLKLVASTAAYDDLNAKEQERINALSIISILEQNTAEESKSLPTFLQSASGLIGVAKAEFQDLLTTIGQKFAPVLKEILTAIIQIFERLNKYLTDNEAEMEVFITFLAAFARFTGVIVLGLVDLGAKLGEISKKIYGFLGALPLMGDAVKSLFPDTKYEDTPTAPFNPSSIAENGEKAAEEVEKAEEKITDIMKDARDKRLDLERDYQNKLSDIDRDYANKLSDIARDTEDKKEDALRDYNQKVEDINRDTNQKVQELQDEAKQKEIDREKEFQQKLKELREKFLFDLEDALHERDARQVLRLVREYNRDKSNLEDRHKLEQAEAAQTLQIRIQQLEQERLLKLAAAKRDYDEKIVEIGIGERRALEEAAIWKRRQLEDARIWYQRQLQQNRDYLQRRLKDVADALGKELQINATAAQGVMSIWSNAFASLLSGFNSSISEFLMPNIGTGGAIVGGSYTNAAAGWAAQAATFANSGMYGTGGTGFAEGGTLVATHPMTATFGEVPEVVSFQPLNGGNNVGKTFGDTSALGGGMLELLLTLSPDLEARLVKKSLDGAADVLIKINRSKL